MTQQVTLRVILIKLRLLESVTRYSKAQVTIQFGKLSKVIPNPRFIQNKQANFYRQRLQLTNKPTQKAFIKVYGIKNSESEMEEIASQHIYVSSIKESRVFVLSNNKIKLEYEAVVIKNYEDRSLGLDYDNEENDGEIENDEGEDSRTEVALDTEKLSGRIHFEPIGFKRASTINMGDMGLKSAGKFKDKDDAKTRDKSPMLSEKEFKHAHETLTNYQENSNGEKYDDLWNNRSEINFLEPITHTPPRSPKDSVAKIDSEDGENRRKDKGRERQREKGSDRGGVSVRGEGNKEGKKEGKEQSSVILFIVTAIISFLLGMLIKQNS